MQQGRQVDGNDASEVVVQGLGPAVRLCEIDPGVFRAGNDLAPVEVLGKPYRADADVQIGSFLFPDPVTQVSPRFAWLNLGLFYGNPFGILNKAHKGQPLEIPVGITN